MQTIYDYIGDNAHPILNDIDNDRSGIHISGDSNMGCGVMEPQRGIICKHRTRRSHDDSGRYNCKRWIL